MNLIELKEIRKQILIIKIITSLCKYNSKLEWDGKPNWSLIFLQLFIYKESLLNKSNKSDVTKKYESIRGKFIE